MRALILRLTPRRRPGKRAIPVHLRPLPSWPPPTDPWATTAETVVLPRQASPYASPHHQWEASR